MREMIAAFDATDADDSVRAVIVTGAATAPFVPARICRAARRRSIMREANGATPRDRPFAPTAASITHTRRCAMAAASCRLRIFASKKPVIGAINGAAVGIGATMTLPMDFRLASDTARFGFVFARRGIVPGGDIELVPAAPRRHRAGAGMVLFGRVFGAEEALRGGLVRSVHAPDDLLPAARALAHELTAAARRCRSR